MEKTMEKKKIMEKSWKKQDICFTLPLLYKQRLNGWWYWMCSLTLYYNCDTTFMVQFMTIYLMLTENLTSNYYFFPNSHVTNYVNLPKYCHKNVHNEYSSKCIYVYVISSCQMNGECQAPRCWMRYRAVRDWIQRASRWPWRGALTGEGLPTPPRGSPQLHAGQLSQSRVTEICIFFGTNKVHLGVTLW